MDTTVFSLTVQPASLLSAHSQILWKSITELFCVSYNTCVLRGGALFHMDPCPPTLLRANRCQLFSSQSSGHKEAASLPMKQFQLLKRRPPRLASPPSPPSSLSPTAAYKASSVYIFFCLGRGNALQITRQPPQPQPAPNHNKSDKILPGW